MRLCRVCKVDKDSKRCTGCYMVWYCGQECQVGDWPAHKTDCKVTRDQYKQVLLVEQKTAVCSFILESGSSNDRMWMFLPVSQNSAVLTLQFVQGMKGSSFCARIEGLPMGGIQW